MARFPLALVLLVAAVVPARAHHGLGTDLSSLNLCLYGDCEARGTYAADPYGLYNPGVLTVPSVLHMPRGVALSGSYFDLELGAVSGNVGAGVATLSLLPVVVQVATVYAEAGGPVRELPGVSMHFRTRAVRLAVGVDLERTLGLHGLSVGLAGIVPGTETDIRLLARGRSIIRSHERRELELVPGVHWRGGAHDWLMLGAFVDAQRNPTRTDGIDPLSGGPLRRRGVNNVWFARAGMSARPFVPLGLTEGNTAAAQWLRDLRVGLDVEYRSIAVPSEPSDSGAVAYLGADAPLVPDALNPLVGFVRPWVLGGVDTRGGWGGGFGLYGQGVLGFLGCNAAWSQRPLIEFLGDRATTFAVTCSAMLPL